METGHVGHVRTKYIIEWGSNVSSSSLSYEKCVDIINLYNDYIFEKFSNINTKEEILKNLKSLNNLEELKPLNLQEGKQGEWRFDLEASEIMVRFFSSADDKLLDDLLPQMEVEKSELEQFLSTFKGWIEIGKKAGTGDLVIDWF